MIDEDKQLRTELAKRRPDKLWQYGDELRHRILDWLAHCIGDGMPDSECSKMLGIKVNRFTVWRVAAGLEHVNPIALAWLPRPRDARAELDRMAAPPDSPPTEASWMSRLAAAAAPVGPRIARVGQR